MGKARPLFRWWSDSKANGKLLGTGRRWVNRLRTWCGFSLQVWEGQWEFGKQVGQLSFTTVRNGAPSPFLHGQQQEQYHPPIPSIPSRLKRWKYNPLPDGALVTFQLKGRDEPCGLMRWVMTSGGLFNCGPAASGGFKDALFSDLFRLLRSHLEHQVPESQLELDSFDADTSLVTVLLIPGFGCIVKDAVEVLISATSSDFVCVN